MAADVRWLGHSAFHLSGAGAELGATYIVPVLVQVQSGRVQMHAQLVRASSQAVLGSATERGVLGDSSFFDVQERLASRLAGLLRAQLHMNMSPAQPPAPPATAVLQTSPFWHSLSLVQVALRVSLQPVEATVVSSPATTRARVVVLTASPS